MRVFIFVSLLMVFTTAVRAVEPPLVLVVGDSLSAGYGIDKESGWVKLLQYRLNALEQPYQIVNASISGDTTRGGLQRLPQALQTWKPAVVIIELGGNDGLRGLSLKSMSANLDKMIQLSLDVGAKVLLVGIRLPINYGKIYGDRFYDIYPQLSRKHHIPLVPFLLESVADDKVLMQPDGIHPKAVAQSILLATVYEYLSPMLLVPE